jgi:hypothetical protein
MCGFCNFSRNDFLEGVDAFARGVEGIHEMHGYDLLGRINQHKIILGFGKWGEKELRTRFDLWYVVDFAWFAVHVRDKIFGGFAIRTWVASHYSATGLVSFCMRSEE